MGLVGREKRRARQLGASQPEAEEAGRQGRQYVDEENEPRDSI